MASIQKLAVLDPVIDFKEQKWISVIGSSQGNFHEIPADSYNSSGISFNVILPSRDRHIIDRSFGVIDIPITIVGAGSGGSGNLWKTNTNGLRPIESVIRNLSFQSNSLSVSYPCSDIYNEMNSFDVDMSDPLDSVDRCTSYPDQYGSVSSQFSSVFDSQLGTNYTRGSHPITINSNSGTAFNISTVFRMRLGKYPPFVKSKERKHGINLVPFKMLIDFENSLNRLVALDATNNTVNLSSLSFTIGQPLLTLRVLSLPDNVVMPREISYPYHQMTLFTNDNAASVSSEASTTIHSQVLQLDTVPGRIIVFARPSKNSVFGSLATSVSSPQWYGALQDGGVKITWGNENNLFATGSQDEYYNMSKECGYKFSLIDWIGNGGSATTLAGSVFAFSPERHLGLKQGQMVSMNGKINFKVSYTFKNQSAATTIFDLVVLVIYDGIVSIKDGFATATNIVFNSPNELQTSGKSYEELMGGTDYKGLFGRIWNELKDAHDVVRDNKIISKIAQNIPHPYAKIVGDVSSAIGYGNSGGVLIGGRQMDREEMVRKMAKVRSFKKNIF